MEALSKEVVKSRQKLLCPLFKTKQKVRIILNDMISVQVHNKPF